MTENGDEQRLIDELQDMLKTNDKIFLVKCADEEYIFSKLRDSKVIKSEKQKVLILSTSNQKEFPGVYYRKISDDDSEFYYRLYHMYEFSDRFQVLSNELCFGNLFNFVNQGLLSFDEMLGALLK